MDPIQAPQAGQESSQAQSLAETIANVGSKHLGAEPPALEQKKRRKGNPNWIKGGSQASRDASKAYAPQSLSGLGQDSACPIDKELVKKSVASLLKVVDGVVSRAIFRSAMSISENDRPFSLEIVSGAQMTTDEQELMAGLSAEVCERWQLLGKYAPELLLGICVIGYGGRVWFTTQKLREFAEVQKSKKVDAKSN